MKRWSCAWLALAASAGAGELPLQLTGEGAYYTLRVPLEVRAQATSAGLDDLRVLNAAGQAVPHAWVDDDPGVAPTPRRQAVRLFKAPPPARAASEPEQPGGWIIDLRAVKGVPQELQLDLSPGTNGIFPFALEASADLQQWRTLLPEAQLVALQHQGQRLAHRSFELAQSGTVAQAGYLRLRPLPGGTQPPLVAAHVASLAHQAELPDWQWSEALAPARCQPGHCDYLLPRHLPLQRVEFLLAEANTLARVELQGLPDEERGAASERRAEALRERVRMLREKQAPASALQGSKDEVALRLLATGTVYSLDVQGRALRSTLLALPDARLYRSLRVRPTGGMAQLGAVPPTLRVAGAARSLVFLARGPGPYRLAWAQKSAPAVLPLDQLMPGHRSGDPLPESIAVVEDSPRTARPAAVAASVAVRVRREASLPSNGNSKLWLWGVLAGALALMGLMARSLLKAPAKPEA
jgi:hypothetical protein